MFQKKILLLLLLFFTTSMSTADSQPLPRSPLPILGFLSCCCCCCFHFVVCKFLCFRKKSCCCCCCFLQHQCQPPTLKLSLGHRSPVSHWLSVTPLDDGPHTWFSFLMLLLVLYVCLLFICYL